jgi:hypothetical protein
MNTALLTQPVKRDKWFKEPWLILVVGGPLTVVCASLFTGYVAWKGADQVVAKDYYKQGLMINTNLQRDAKARELQLNAKMHLDVQTQTLSMSLKSRQVLPDVIQVSLAVSGASSGSVDEIIRRFPLRLVAPDRYEGSLVKDDQGKKLGDFGVSSLFHVKVETNDWRLTSDWHNPLQADLDLRPAR